jgi:hypothetical protein
MKKRIIDLRDEKPLLDIAAYARKGRIPTPAERLHISLTVHRAPEVMVKVSGGARTLSGVERHIAYIGRDGRLGLGVDADGQIAGKGFERDVVRDWDLDVDVLQNHTRNSATPRKPPKLVHNIIFSMPPGTSPRAVLKAVQKLALNEWALQHRYAMALHTDDDHPHVHVVLKALSEEGVRLNIRKATLRAWRAQFATNLRELGVDANATERAIRGQTNTRKLDGIYRADQRGQSTHFFRRRSKALRELSSDEHDARSVMESTRRSVSIGWRRLAETLYASGDHKLSEQVRFFESRIPPIRTEGERLAEEQLAQGRILSGERERPPYDH